MLYKRSILFALLVTIAKSELCTEKNCTCTTTAGKMSIDCHSLGMTEIPSPFVDLPKNVLTLDLSKNDITSIPNLREIDGLKNMKLNDNKITHVAPDAFQNLSYLESLDLRNNQINDLTGLFGLSGLRYLNLSENYIRSVPVGMFSHMSELVELRVSGNPLHFVPYDMFRSLSKVQLLDLSACALLRLPEGVFHDMLLLVELDLSRNLFEEVPTAGLQSASVLKTLKMNSNQITTIKANSFKRCGSLENLELSDMGTLGTIEAGAFAGLKQLQVLKVSHNPNLKTLDFGAFEGLYNTQEQKWYLQELVLRDNGLEKIISPSTTLCSIVTLDMQGNPWKCDCSMRWITECHVKDELTNDIKCAGPGALKDRLIRETGPDEYVCPKDPMLEHQQKVLRIVAVTSGLAAILFCVIIVIIVVKKRKIMEWWYYRKRGQGAVYYVKANTNPKDARGDI